MKVAVFGDSFADEILNKEDSGYKSWVELLREKYYPDLTCYAESGSSLYFSYNLFRQHHENYDKIIFVTTTHDRITIPSYIKFKQHNRSHLMYHINSIATAEEHLRDKMGIMTEQGILATKAAIEYYKYLHDHRRDCTLNVLMKESISKLRSDVVLVDTLNPGLSEISYYEFDQSGNRPAEMWEYHDYRMCHMTKRNNEILAEKMFEWTNGAPVRIDVSDFVVPPREELFKLLVKR